MPVLTPAPILTTTLQRRSTQADHPQELRLSRGNESSKHFLPQRLGPSREGRDPEPFYCEKLTPIFKVLERRCTVQLLNMNMHMKSCFRFHEILGFVHARKSLHPALMLCAVALHHRYNGFIYFIYTQLCETNFPSARVLLHTTLRVLLPRAVRKACCGRITN